MMKKILCLISLLSLAIAQNEFTQFETVSLQNGLSDVLVKDIVQDKEGFLWIATSDGLNRYDGYSVKIYRNQGLGQNELSQNNIRVLAVDKHGTIWIGENNGIDLLNPYTERFTSLRFSSQQKNSLSSNRITAIIKDFDGSMWVGTDRGLNHFDYKTQSFTRFNYSASDANSISNDKITSFYLDLQGNLWVGTENGINRYDRQAKNFQSYGKSSSSRLSFPIITSIATFDNEQLILGVSNSERTRNDILLLDTKNERLTASSRITSVIKRYAANGLKAIHTSGSNIWFSTYANDGLHLLRTKANSIRSFRQNDPDVTRLSHDNIQKIISDKNGMIWLATAGGGLSKLRYARNRHFLSMKRNPRRGSNTLSNNQITSIYEDSNDEVWYGTINGLNRYNPRRKRIRVYYPNPNRNSLSNATVQCILEDLYGGFWIGTPNGLNKLDRRRHRFTSYFTRNSSLPDNNITALLNGKNNTVWIGTSNGLSRVAARSTNFSNFRSRANDSTSLVNNHIQALAMEESGAIWIGTKAGLSRFNPASRTFTNYKYSRNNLQSISHNTILSITVDENNAVWIGTENGMSRYNRSTNDFTRYSTRDGLPNTTIYGMLEDNNKTLWISTNKGLSKFDYEESRFKNYDISDGLVSNEFNQFAAHAGFSGRLYFGTPNGSVEFFPERLLKNQKDPKLVFTDFQINFKDFNIDSGYNKITELNLDYDQRSISFNLIPIEYTSPSKNSFLYKMEGINTDWVNAGSRRFISFPLQPTSYVFKARAINSDGKISNFIKELRITVHPPFWKASWFQLLLIIFVIGLISLLLYFRNRAQQLREQELEKEVFQRTKELRDKSKEIEQTNEDLEKEIITRRDTETALRSAREETDSILENVNQGLFLLDPLFEISNQYSAELENIFRKKDLAKTKFVSLMKPLVTRKTLDELNDFIELLFNEDIDEYAMHELNPLDRVELHFEIEKGEYHTKHLEFLFRRVISEDKIVSLLVTARDITEIIELQEELKKTQDKNKMEMEQLLSILRADPNQLREYLKTIDVELVQISRLFKEEKGGYRSILEKAFRVIHNLKGNASMLDLEFYVVKFHEMEEIMSRVLDKRKITGDDFLPIIIEINEINSYQDGMNDLIDRVIAMSDQLQSIDRSEENPQKKLERNLSSFLEKLSSSLDKKAKLKIDFTSEKKLSSKYQKLLQDVSTQLIRNSLIHGIESDDERQKRGKDMEALLKIDIQQENGHISYTYRDDGRGLDIEKIKQKAIRNDLIDESKVKDMKNSEIARLIFRDGFTTLDTTSKDAGRGEGMSMIKGMVSKYKGKMKFAFSKGSYFELSVNFNTQE